MTARKYARLRQAGAQGLRRGAWYSVVNDMSTEMVVLDVYKRNVPVPRSMLILSDQRPERWTVVKWEQHQRGAARVSQEKDMWPMYAVCPTCAARAKIEPPDATRMRCPDCDSEAEVDWANPG